MSSFRFSGRYSARALVLGATALAAAFLAVGFVGVQRYGNNYWLYRGFPPPSDPAYVTQPGAEQRIAVTSPALGGRNQEVYVYLPPGYDAHPNKRYPVVYLLHGFPGRPLAFLLTVRLGVVEDELYAKGRGQPVILVMPFGSTACLRAATARSTSLCTTRTSSRSSRAGRATNGRRTSARSSATIWRISRTTLRSTHWRAQRRRCDAHTCTSGSTPGWTIRCARRTASSPKS